MLPKMKRIIGLYIHKWIKKDFIRVVREKWVSGVKWVTLLLSKIDNGQQTIDNYAKDGRPGVV